MLGCIPRSCFLRTHQVFRCHINLSLGHLPELSWRRCPGALGTGGLTNSAGTTIHILLTSGDEPSCGDTRGVTLRSLVTYALTTKMAQEWTLEKLFLQTNQQCHCTAAAAASINIINVLYVFTFLFIKCVRCDFKVILKLFFLCILSIYSLYSLCYVMCYLVYNCSVCHIF